MNKLYGFFKILVGDNRKNRSENFVFHDFHVGRDICENCNRRIAIVDIAYASNHLCRTFGNGVFNEVSVAFCSAFIYNMYKVFALMALGVSISEHLLDFICKWFCKFLNFVLRTKCVVRCDACLARVQCFAPSELLDVALDICFREYNCRRFPTELKRNACVILGCHFCNVCADIWTPCEKYMIEREC